MKSLRVAPGQGFSTEMIADLSANQPEGKLSSNERASKGRRIFPPPHRLPVIRMAFGVRVGTHSRCSFSNFPCFHFYSPSVCVCCFFFFFPLSTCGCNLRITSRDPATTCHCRSRSSGLSVVVEHFPATRQLGERRTKAEAFRTEERKFHQPKISPSFQSSVTPAMGLGSNLIASGKTWVPCGQRAKERRGGFFPSEECRSPRGLCHQNIC